MRGDSLRWVNNGYTNGPLKWSSIGPYGTHPLIYYNVLFLLENRGSKKSSSSGIRKGTKLGLLLSGGGNTDVPVFKCGGKWEDENPVKRLSPMQSSPDILTKTNYLYKSYQQFLVLTV